MNSNWRTFANARSASLAAISAMPNVRLVFEADRLLPAR